MLNLFRLILLGTVVQNGFGQNSGSGQYASGGSGQYASGGSGQYASGGGGGCPRGSYRSEQRRRFLHTRPLSHPLPSDRELDHEEHMYLDNVSSTVPKITATQTTSLPKKKSRLNIPPIYFLEQSSKNNNASFNKLSSLGMKTARFEMLTRDTSTVHWVKSVPTAPIPQLPLYWINLGRSTIRGENIKHQLHQLQWSSATRIEAIDGTAHGGSVSRNPYIALQDKIRVGKTPIEELPCLQQACTPMQLATLLSHLRALRQAWSDGHEYVLIAEDDVDFTIYDESILWQVVNKLPKHWGSLQLYTGNSDLLEMLFKQFSGSGFTPRNNLIHPWSSACILYSRHGMQRILDQFGYEYRFDFTKDFTSLTHSLEADSIIPRMLGASAFISTRPMVNVHLAASNIDKHHIKALLADMTMSAFAHRFAGKAWGVTTYGPMREILKTASHLRTLAHAYRAGLEQVVVVSNGLTEDDIDFRAVESVINQATCGGRGGRTGRGKAHHAEQCLDNGLVQLLAPNTRRESGTGVSRRPQDDYRFSVGATSLYAVVGRKALKAFSKLWDEKTKTVTVPFNGTFVADVFMYHYLDKVLEGSSPPVYAPNAMTVRQHILAQTTKDPFDVALDSLRRSSTAHRLLYQCINCTALSVVNANCTACSSATTCTALSSCATNTFDSDGDATNGCESSFDCSSISVAFTNCTKCSDATTCTALSSCAINTHNWDGDASNGCESSFDCSRISVASANCTKCSDATTCTALSCSVGMSDQDGDVSNGCEAPTAFIITTGSDACELVDNYTCVQTVNYPNIYAYSKTCTIAVNMAGNLKVVGFDVEPHNLCDWDSLTVHGTKYCGTTGPSNVVVGRGDTMAWSSDSIDVRSGFKICRIDCAGISVANASCTACSDSTTCTALSCLVGASDQDGDVSNGCEGTHTFFSPVDFAALKVAVDGCLNENANGSCPIFAASNDTTGNPHGAMGDWDVSRLTIMGGVSKTTGLFSAAAAFNADISKWNTEKATDLSHMFYGANAFNVDISKWDTGKVARMNYMFLNAVAFNADVSKWNIVQVTGTADMFVNAQQFTHRWCSTEWARVITDRAFVGSSGRVICCPPGHFYNDTNGGKSTCEFCSIGKHNNRTRVTNNLPTNCIACPRNTFAPIRGLPECSDCEKDQFSNALSKLCSKCPSGFKMLDKTTGAETTCAKCDSGQFQNVPGSETCQDCPIGFYQDQIGVPYCVECIPGQFQNEQGKQQCHECLAGQHRFNTINGTNLTKCDDCPAGKVTPLTGAAKCIDCIPGQFQNEKGNEHCIKCATGRRFNASVAVGVSPSDCVACDKGQHQSERGATFCLPCLTGTYQNETGCASCKDCPIGFSNGNTKAASCAECSKGSYQDAVNQANCKNCKAGTYSTKIGAISDIVCMGCPLGRYSSATGLTNRNECNKCAAGKKNPNYGSINSSACVDCVANTKAPNEGSSECVPCDAGSNSDEGSAKCIACGAGTFGEGCKKCPLGFARITSDPAAHCQQCQPGLTTTTRGAATCSGCDLGKYGTDNGTCHACSSKQYQDTRGQTNCKTCAMANGEIPNEKQTGCEAPPYGFCTLGEEYLNDTAAHAQDWSCEKCPFGSECRYSIPTFSTLGSRVGFHPMSWHNHSFGACPSTFACNASFPTGGCAVGHNPNASELCSQCLPGYASQSRNELCTLCPEQAETTVLFLGAILLAVALFCFLVWDNLDGANEMVEMASAASATAPRQQEKNADTGLPPTSTIVMPFHSIVIRIVSSYLQVAGMLLQFDLYLPLSVRTLIVVESSTSSLSEQLLLFDCGTAVRNDRDLFLLKQGTSVWIIPVCSVVGCLMFWSLYHFLGCCRKKRSSMTGFDGFVASLMVLFYTLFPSVVNRIALTFSCKDYGSGTHKRMLLTEALSVQCYSPEHVFIVGAIGIPGMSIYIGIVPFLIAMLLIRERRSKRLYPSQNHYQSKWTLRFGFMFAGYREGYEWWEVVVMLRKCCFVLLAIFLRPYGAAPQVVAASLVLVAALSATLQHLPYQDSDHDRIEVIGIQACLLQLMVALICNFVQDDGSGGGGAGGGTNNTLGPKSTAVLITMVFGSTVYFFVITIRATILGSLETSGFVGLLAVVLKERCRIGSRKVTRKRSSSAVIVPITAPLVHEEQQGDGKERNVAYQSLAKVVPTQQEEEQQQQRSRLQKDIAALKWQKNIRQTLTKNTKFMRRVKSTRTKTVEEIETNHHNHRALALKNIKEQHNKRRSSLQLRVQARSAIRKSASAGIDTHGSETPVEIKRGEATSNRALKMPTGVNEGVALQENKDTATSGLSDNSKDHSNLARTVVKAEEHVETHTKRFPKTIDREKLLKSLRLQQRIQRIKEVQVRRLKEKRLAKGE